MELVKVENLLEKYFEGETSLEQEAQLRNYFTTHKVPAHLETYQDLFGYFDSKLNESYKKPLLAESKIKIPYKWLSIAASVAIIFSVLVFNNQSKKTSEAQIAQSYKNTQEALQLISKNINKGAFAMAQLGEFDKTKDIIFKEK